MFEQPLGPSLALPDARCPPARSSRSEASFLPNPRARNAADHFENKLTDRPLEEGRRSHPPLFGRYDYFD